MPGKVNPVQAEMLNMAMFHVIGCDTTVALGAQAGQLELNVMMPVIAHNLFEMMHITIGAVRSFTQRAVVGLKANAPRATAWLERNAIVATALTPLIGYGAAARSSKRRWSESVDPSWPRRGAAPGVHRRLEPQADAPDIQRAWEVCDRYRQQDPRWRTWLIEFLLGALPTSQSQNCAKVVAQPLGRVLIPHLADPG
jgi:hypothetical protein